MNEPKISNNASVLEMSVWDSSMWRSLVNSQVICWKRRIKLRTIKIEWDRVVIGLWDGVDILLSDLDVGYTGVYTLYTL